MVMVEPEAGEGPQLGTNTIWGCISVSVHACNDVPCTSVLRQNGVVLPSNTGADVG